MRVFFWILFGFCLASLSSCVRYKDYVYIQANDKNGDTLYYKETYKEYRLKKKDVLYIHVASLNPQIKSIFDQQIMAAGTASDKGNEGSNSGYLIDEDGWVQVALLGKFKAEGKTVRELEKEVQAQTNLKFNDAIVTMRLSSFRISFFGEISATTIHVNKDRINILEAISMAGGIQESGNKKSVLIMRPTEKGTQTFRMDLTSRSLLCDQNYYLQPNDMIYVEPRRGRFLQNGASTYFSIVSTITTTISIIFLVINLTK